MRNKVSRRKFIVRAVAGSLLSPAVLAGNTLPVNKHGSTLTNGQVFLFQGDSITDGNRGRNMDPNHIMGHGYAFAVASRVGADFPAAGHTFYNRGVSGNRVPDLQQRWQADTLSLEPTVLSILIGINDTNAAVENAPGAQTADEFETGYRRLLQQAKAAKPETLFILGLPFVNAVGKRKDNWQQWRDGTAQRAEKVKKLAGEFDAVLVDYPALFDKARQKAPAEYWLWDGIHPTVPAHELMAREWLKQTSKRLPFLKRYI